MGSIINIEQSNPSVRVCGNEFCFRERCSNGELLPFLRVTPFGLRCDSCTEKVPSVRHTYDVVSAGETNRWRVARDLGRHLVMNHVINAPYDDIVSLCRAAYHPQLEMMCSTPITMLGIEQMYCCPCHCQAVFPSIEAYRIHCQDAGSLCHFRGEGAKSLVVFDINVPSSQMLASTYRHHSLHREGCCQTGTVISNRWPHIPLLLPDNFAMSPNAGQFLSRRNRTLYFRDGPFANQRVFLERVSESHAQYLLHKMLPFYNLTRSGYHKGVLYSSELPGSCLVVSGDELRQKPFHLSLTLPNGRTSVIFAERVDHNAALMESMADLFQTGRLQYQNGNVRHERKDLGAMFGLGFHMKDGVEVVYAPTYHVIAPLAKFTDLAARQSEVSFPFVCDNIRQSSLGRQSGEMGGPRQLSRAGYASVNLSNSAHWDKNDRSYTAGFFGKLFPSVRDGKFMLFPDVSVNGSQGLAIELSHGTMVVWEGSVLRHCTTLGNGLDNDTYGFAFVAAN